MNVEERANESEIDADSLARMYIRSLLKGGEPLPRKDIAERLGKKFDETTISRNLLTLKFAGEIELIDQGYRMKQ